MSTDSGPGENMSATDRLGRVFGAPKTVLGWTSICLALAVFVLVALGTIRAGHHPPGRMRDDPINTAIALSAFASAILGGVFAVAAVMLRRERSIALVLPMLVGAATVIVVVGYWLEGQSR